MHARLGMSGRIAAAFMNARITPLLALVALLLGLFAMSVTPREEEPQINVTMANVLIPFPGAEVGDVEQMVTAPAEQVLGQIADIEHIFAVSRPGMAMLTVQFKVGVPRTEALVRLYNALHSHRDWLPPGLGVLEPLVKPKGIDDVPIVSLTLFSRDAHTGAEGLEAVAHSVEAELKRVKGSAEVRTLGGSGRAINVLLDPARLSANGLSVAEVQAALQGASVRLPAGETVRGNRSVQIEAGAFFADAGDVAELIVGSRAGRPVFLNQVAEIEEGPPPATHAVWHHERIEGGQGMARYPAVTLSVTKQPGQNAVDVAAALERRVQDLRNTVIPHDVQVSVTRNYGETANDKAQKLMQKLLFATASVVALVFLTLGRREALIVGSAVLLTLTATLFASWAWGFTLNRVSLFALIFSIGILVDDAIVVVENIHRHRALHPDEQDLLKLIPRAVDEVGGPTILATFTVIAALLPMAFVSGLMGPYMAPIPINASMGMLLSLAIAFVVTPWLARQLLGRHGAATAAEHAPREGRVARLLRRIFAPFLDERTGGRARIKLTLAILALIAVSVLLPVLGWVQLKMLPFDNKSEFQVVVDMPAGTPLEETAAVLDQLGHALEGMPEVAHYQTYAGTAAPINFNGLVRQYDLRAQPELGDIQVNLVDKHHRSEKSHVLAMRARQRLAPLAVRLGARLKVVEVPPGPPVMAPIVAEIYGPEAAGRAQLAQALHRIFAQTEGVVDADDSSIAAAPRIQVAVDRKKAALAGVPAATIVQALHAALAGEDAAYLHDQSKYPRAVRLSLPESGKGDLEQALALGVRSSDGRLVPLRELVQRIDAQRAQPAYRKDGLPVHYVTGDMAGRIDSPLYGMFAMTGKVAALRAPNGSPVEQWFFHAPGDPYRHYSLKWDGEWQVTFETFRDMGAAYAVGLVLIYLLVVAQFGSYVTPLIIMAPIPLTLIGVMPGHALLGAQFTATSMIGMIALAGIIVRNSILLVDFIGLEVARGVPFAQAVVHSALTRAQPIALTGLAAMLGAFFILDDPIFNGLAISLIFGIFVSTLLTLVVIPLLYYSVYRRSAGRSSLP